MKKILLIFILGMFLISFASASLGTFKQNSCVSLYQYCDDCSYVTLTKIQYPNGTILTINDAMTKDDVNYNYTFCGTETLGTYYYTVKGDAGGSVKVERLSFKITPSGQDFDTGQTLGGLGLFAGVLAVAFAFMFIGSKLGKEDKTLPIGFFFIVMSIFLVIYSLHLGWVFSNDILQHEILSQGVQTIFVVVIWTSAGIAIIFIVLMLIAFIKELGKITEKKKFGENWNPITGTYE